MRPFRALAAVFAFAGAIALPGCSKPTPQSNVEAFCRDYANNDPEVRRIREIGAGSSIWMADHQLELRGKLNTANQKCLVAHGAAPRGGVAVGQPTWYGPLF